MSTKEVTHAEHATRRTGGTYRALQAVAPGRLETADLPIQDPPPGHVRIRVEACGVCHSDALTVEGGFPDIVYPRVPGHEVVGRIDALGSGVDAWRIGERVGIGFLGGYSGICSTRHRGDLASGQQQPLSGVHTDGGYAELMVARSSALAAIPEELSPAEAAPLLCAGLTTFNALRKANARAGDVVAIQGVGGLGHLAIQYARCMGFKVIAIARGTEKRAIALKLGAHAYIDSTASDPAAELHRLGGAKAILATAANNSSMSSLIDGLASGGEMLVAGVGNDQLIGVHAGHLVLGQHAIVGTLTGTPADCEDTLAFSSLYGVRAMVETFPLAEAPQAYGRMIRNEAHFRAVLVAR